MSYHTEPKMRFQETRGIVTVLLARAARGRDRPDPQPSGRGIHRPVPRFSLASRLAGVGRSAAGTPARALAVVLLVACAALLAAPRPAQAQTVCSSAADWCATMTVGYTSTVTGSTTVEHFGYELDTSFGALDDDDFAYLGTDYTVAGIIQFKETASGDVTSNAISLLTNPSLPDGTVLTVNRTELTVGPGSHSSDVGQEVWDLLDLGITLGLVQDQMVLVSLELPPPPQHPGSLQGGPQIVFAANAGASEPTARCLSAPYELRRWANRPGGITATWSLDVVEPSGGFRNGASFTASDFDISNGQVKTIAGVNYPHQEASADVQPFEMVITAAVGFRAKSRTVQVHILKSDRTDHAWHNVCGQTPGEPPRRPRMRVADTEEHEAPGATLDFVVTLNRAAPVTMTADYWTYAGTATDGADYLHRYGTLTFAVGESEKTVRVPIIDDSVEDDGETVHFALHNPTGGVAIADDEAVGIIRNSESPPTATFGEAPASHDGSTAFVVPVEFSGAVTLTAASPSVSGGTVTGVTDTAGDGTSWDITIEPSGESAVGLTLAVASDCAAAGAICTANGRALSEAVTVSIAYGPAVVPLTAEFTDVPDEHGGSSAFTFRLAFSEDIRNSYRKLRDDLLSATGGTVTRARRVDGRSDLWEIQVEPSGSGPVTVTLPEGERCGTAPCTADRRSLSQTVTATIEGPPGLSVADAEVEEGPGARLRFSVTLARPAPGTVTVQAATSDGTALAGEDYRAKTVTKTFAPGETSKIVVITVLDDAHDEGAETLTLTLSNPSSAFLADGEATGTIKNQDPLPRALLAGSDGRPRCTWSSTWRNGSRRGGNPASKAGSRGVSCGGAWSATSHSAS